MSDSDAIGDVTNTLVELLKSRQVPLGRFSVSAHSPTDEAVPGGNSGRLNVFLFRIVENPFLRNEDWQPEGSDSLRYPPLCVDLYYILTAFASQDPPGQEHVVLGEAMRVLHDFSIIQKPDLKGGLPDTVDEIRIEMWQMSLEDMSRIWSALTKPYRLSVGYVVRNLRIDSQFTQKVQRVLEKHDDWSKKEPEG